MLKTMPLAGVLVIAVVIGGLVPFLLGLVGGPFGIVGLVVVVAGLTFWLNKEVVIPLKELSTNVQSLEKSIENESELPDLAPKSGISGVEILNLTTSLEQVGNAYQNRLTELNSIHAISQTITSSTLDYTKTVKSVLEAVQKVVDYDAAEVSVLRGNTLIVEAWWGKEGFKDTTGRKYRTGRGPTGMMAATKEPLFLPTVQATEDLQRTIGYASVETEFIAKTTKLVINSFLGIPLMIGDRLVGTLGLVHHEAGFFTEDNKRQLNKLADHASIAIDNAIQVREREESLRQQIEELRIEIDEAKLVQQVEEVTDTEYFRNLQANAAKMRERRRRPEAEDEKSENDESDTVEDSDEK